MTELEADIDLNWQRHPRFNANFGQTANGCANEVLAEMRASGRTLSPSEVYAQRHRSVDFSGQSITRNHGGLGEFSVHCRGTLSITVYGDAHWTWSFAGQMQWSDRWDFELRPAGSDDRTSEGRRQTRWAHYALVGTPFSVSSPWMDIRQTSEQRRAIWVGNDGTHEPRNIPTRY
jgi:hypothetical protein